MDIILIATLVFVTLTALGYPLINARQYRYANALRGNGQLESLEHARAQAMDALRDLQFDYNTGKLSDADYQSLRAQYELKAAQILQQLDALKGLAPNGKRAAPAVKRICPRCHAALDTSDKFCAKCGARVASGG